MEMEIINLMALNNTELLSKFQKIFSSSSEERKNAITTLLTHEDILNLEQIKLVNADSADNIQMIINEYFTAIGLKFEDIEETNND